MKPVNTMSRAQLTKEYEQNVECQDKLREKLIAMGYGRVMSFELNTLDVVEANQKDILMRRLSNISMELESIRLGYRKATPSKAV
jgi:ATP phosphoribosyltransferase regulatory subunit HisZ